MNRLNIKLDAHAIIVTDGGVEKTKFRKIKIKMKFKMLTITPIITMFDIGKIMER